MVAGSLKSRSKRRVFVKTPGGKTVRTYRLRKPGRHVCGGCGTRLPGIPHLLSSKFKNLAKTKKRPQRPYGGVLCSSCTRAEMVNKARGMMQ